MKTMKRIIASLLIAVISFSPLGYAYDDVPTSNKYRNAVDYLQREGVFNGGRFFKPDILINKAEFIKYLVKLNSEEFQPSSTADLPFSDTRNNAWYASYLKEAIELGILDASDDKAYPYKKLTIAEALELLFKSRGVAIPDSYEGNVPYKDVANSDRWAPLIMKAVEIDVVTPDKAKTFGLYKRLSRGRAAHIIWRMDLAKIPENQKKSPNVKDSGDAQEVVINLGSTINNYDNGIQKVIDVWSIINNNYLDRASFDKEAASEAAIRAILEELDDQYSTYLNREENAAFSDDLDGTVEGIGAFVGLEENEQITIISPIQDSPAQKAGLKAGDIINKVNGRSTIGMSLEEAVSYIKGPRGTKVKLEIKRGGKTFTVDVTRDVVNIESVAYETIEGGSIMHLKLLQFGTKSASEFEKAIDQVNEDPKIKGVILDMRDNPGGLLNAAVRILGFMLPKGSDAVNIQYNFFNQKQNTRGNNQLANTPMVVLVNKGSASAAEIVAGAIQDNDRAVLIGDVTFGKGTVQEVNYFRDNSSLKLTVAKWLTPGGQDIQGNGVTPDILVSNPEDGSTDLQLKKAISEIKKRF